MLGDTPIDKIVLGLLTEEQLLELRAEANSVEIAVSMLRHDIKDELQRRTQGNPASERVFPDYPTVE